jgi:hypothetical protein
MYLIVKLKKKCGYNYFFKPQGGVTLLIGSEEFLGVSEFLPVVTSLPA